MKSLIILSLVVFSLTVFALGVGAYNIAATEKHWKITEKIMTWARENSVKSHAKNLIVPIIDEADVGLIGAEHYNAMCAICHLAPGRKPTELALGLYPQAPIFHERTLATDEKQRLYTTKKYFWTIKNGIKMTAMPAWGPTHDDESIWAMAAFAHKLHGMTAEQYKTHIDHDHDHDHDHSHHN